jgi:hypothetical protein
MAQYRAAVQDPTLMELRRDIALVDARIIDLLQRVDTGESSAVWQEAKATLRRFHRAQARQDPEKMREHLHVLQELIERGANDYAAWAEIGAEVERRRKLVESEQKRLVLASEMLSAEQAMHLLTVVVDVIKRHIPDAKTLRAIAGDVERLTHVEPRPPLRIVPPLAEEQGG